MNDDAPTLLLLDDDDVFRTRLARALGERGFAVHACASVEEALARIDTEPEYAVLDLRVGGRSGLEVLKAFKSRAAGTRVVMLTGYGSIPTAIEATREGAAEYLAKPADADAVLRALLGVSSPHDPEDTPSLARAEWEYIHRVLAEVNGNVSEASRRLGVHRRSLQRKLQKLPPAR